MKKYIVFAAFMLLPFMSFGQMQIDTKKVRISDFTQKTTKIVLTGNQFHDAGLMSEATAKWTVSPFEFCTLEEFESLKGDDNYYFLLTTKGQFKKESEPGLMFLTLVKGGQNSGKGIGEMLEIVSLPYASAEDPSGREMVFFSAFLDIIQKYTLDAIDKDMNAYIGLPNYSMNISKAGEMILVFSEDDLNAEMTPQMRNLYFDKDILVLSEDEADECLISSKENTLVSYVAAPSVPKPGSYCYKMLIDPQTNVLYYFRRHKITKSAGPGFLIEDFKRITGPRRK